MRRWTLGGVGLLLVTVGPVGCFIHHIPPPTTIGAPLPPGAAERGGWDVAVGATSYMLYPLAAHLRAGKAWSLGEAPLAFELGANTSTGWGGVTPALHWTPPPKPGHDWRWGMRLAVAVGSGDLLTSNRWTEPYLGGSLHGQLSREWDNGGAFTVALGADYTGHTYCLGGCSYTIEVPGYEGCVPQGDKHCPDGTSHVYEPWRSPSLHLRADLPVGQQGLAWMWGLGAQPWTQGGSVTPFFTISTGLHHAGVRSDSATNSY